MKKLLIGLLVVSTITASASVSAESKDHGGGNLLSERITNLLGMIGEDGGRVKQRLQKYIGKLEAYDEENFVVQAGKNLSYMIKNGLAKDLEDSSYAIRGDRCYDESGQEVHASTKRVNLALTPDVDSPSICINILKIAEDNSTIDEITSLLMHEHARHFGFEDTDRFGRHPISEYVSNSIDKIFAFPSMKELKKQSSRSRIEGNRINFSNGTKLGSDVWIASNGTIYSVSRKGLRIVVTKTEGQCKKLGYNITGLSIDGSLSANTVIDFDSYDSNIMKNSGGEFHFNNHLGHRSMNLPFNKTKTCTIDYHIEKDGFRSSTRTKLITNKLPSTNDDFDVYFAPIN